MNNIGGNINTKELRTRTALEMRSFSAIRHKVISATISVPRRIKSFLFVTDARWKRGYDVAKYRSKFMTKRAANEKPRKVFDHNSNVSSHLMGSGSKVSFNHDIAMKASNG
jgi:hypothetical protein